MKSGARGGRRLGKRQAIARIAAVLLSLRKGVDLEEVLQEAQSEVEFHQALAAAFADWPRFNEERAAGDVEGMDPDGPPLTWREYLEYAAEIGEWDAARWGYPEQPTSPGIVIETSAPRSPKPMPLETASEDDFAAAVVARAASCDACQFDPHHAYISRLWRSFRAEGDPVTLEAFKARLVGANQARRLTLSRADYVEAMDPAAVRESEIRYHSARFHFVRL